MPSRSWRSVTFWLVIAVNVILIVLYFWSRGGATTTIRVEAIDSQYKAFVDGELVAQGAFRGAPQGGIGLLLARDYRLPALPDPYGIASVHVTDAETGETIFEDDFSGGPSDLWELEGTGWHVNEGMFTTDTKLPVFTGAQPWSDYILEVKLQNVTEAAVYLRFQDTKNFVVLGVGPFRNFGAAKLHLHEDGVVVSRIDVGRIELDRQQTLQSITAMLLRPYPVLVLMFASIVVLAFVVRQPDLERALRAAAQLVRESATGIVIGLAGGTFVLLFYLLYVLGDAMPHVPDSVMYVFQSKIFASFNAAADAPQSYPTESFHIFNPHMLQVVDGRWFTHYPFGHPLFLAAGQLAGAVWLVPPILGALSLALLYWVGKQVYGVSTGLMAALLLFSSPFFLMTASNFMSHNTAVFTIIACLFLITLPTKHRLPAMLVGGIMIGLLFNMRPLTAVSFIPVLAAFLGYELVRAKPEDRLKLLREDLAFSAGALLMLGAFFLYNNATTGGFNTTAYEVQGTFSEEYFGFNGPHSVDLGLQNQQELLSLLLLVANGWPLAVGLGVAMLPFLFGSRNRWDYFLGASFLAITAAPIFYRSTAIMHGPRFWYEALPFLILLTARGTQYLATTSANAADWLAARVHKSRTTTSTGIASLATYSIICALVAFSLYSWMFGQRAAWGDDQIGVNTFTPQSASELEGFNFVDDRLIQAADQIGPRNALVFVEFCPQWWCYGSVFWTNSPDLQNDIVWAEMQHTPDDLALLEIYSGRDLYIANFAGRSITPTDAEEIAALVEEQQVGDPPPDPITLTTTPEERDETRREDLVVIQSVLNQFADANGTYPNTTGQLQSLCAYRTLDAGCALQEIAAVPLDPLGEPIRNGYWYVSADGTSYILIALQESEAAAPSNCPEGLFGEDDSVGRYCVTGALP